MESEKAVIIGGGVGPLAGVGLHKKVIENTLTDGTDATHLDVRHLSCSPRIADRTAFLLGETEENPATGMAAVVRMAAAGLREFDQNAVVGVPCNTFHAPPIFNQFRELVSNIDGVTVVHMLEETAKLIQELFPELKKVGLLSTTGTRNIAVYRQILEPMGFEVIEVPESIQADVHDSIYNREWGVKAVTPVTEQARSNFEGFIRTLKELGADAVILGCTEIPLAMPEIEFEGTRLIDPVDALARALVKEANPDKLKEL